MFTRLAAAWRALVGPDPDAPARRLLAADPAWVDLIREDLSAYSDAEVGAAVRRLHAEARRSLGWAGSGGEGQDARGGPQEALECPRRAGESPPAPG